MDNKQKSINKMDLLLRAMAKAKGIDPDNQEQQQKWLEDSRKRSESIAQSKPVTPQEALEQTIRLKNSKSNMSPEQQQRMQDWNEKEVKAVKKMQEQPVDWDKIDQYVAEAGGTSMPGRKEV